MSRKLDAMHPELRRRLQEVAKQCRRQVWMSGVRRFAWGLFAVTCLFTVLLAVLSPDGRRGTILAIGYFVSVAMGLIIVLVGVFRKRITIEQVALFIDEHHPELENRMASALGVATDPQAGASEWLIKRFLDETVPIVRVTSFADVLNRKLLFNLTAAAGAMLLSTGIVLFLFSHLWLPSIKFALPEDVAESVALPFTVEPGDVRVRQGDNQMVWVRTEAIDRALHIRWRTLGGSWQENDVSRTGEDRVFFHQFMNIQIDLQYQVQYGRRRSPVYQITTWMPPEVQSIDLTYEYPEYLRRPPQIIPNSGNISAIEGTIVELEVWMNKELKRAELVFESGDRVALERRASQMWAAPITVTKDDVYHIELVDLDEAESEYNPEYKIAMARDKAPEIKIDFPRGDNEVTILEEVPFDFSVTDDFGFDAFGLQYEIAGQEPVRIALNDRDDLILAAEGHHEIRLEDLGLEVGDFITWTVWANDTKPDRSEFEVMGDPYFLEIRPFRRRYREAVSAGGGGGGGMEDGDLDQAQKDVLIATWNLRREARYMDDEEFVEKRDIVIETQDDLIQKLSMTGGGSGAPDAEIIKLRESMRGSSDALGRAALPDPKAVLSEATTHQQMALRLIARMKPRDAQVQQQQGGGGGGGGGGMDQRPDISELEMARNRNFYEQENATREQQEAADEVLKKIKELARRQENVNEELAKLISELQKANTEEEKEELRRRLERLEEEMRQNLDRLDEARQELSGDQLSNEQTRSARESLERARRQMNRTLEQIGKDRLQQARSSGAQAMDALGDIQKHLQQFGRGASAERMRELQEEMDRLRDRQHEISQEAQQAREYHRSPSMEDQKKLDELAESLQAQKQQLSEDFVNMMNEASELAERSQQTQELMSRKLGDWMRETSREGILEDIEESQPLVEYGIWDSAVREEEKIAGKFDEAAERLRRVADSLVEDDLEAMQKSLAMLDELLDKEEVGGRAGGSDESGEEMGRGGEPGEEEGQGRTGEEQEGEGTGQSGESGERMARAQEGQEGGQQAGESGQEGQESSGQSGQSGQPQEGNGQGEQDSPQQQGSSAGGRGGGFDERQAMRDFADSGYLDYLDDLRDIETLLPEGTEFRTEVTRVREGIERIRREWRARALAPQYDLFLEVVARPLEEAADSLQRAIEEELDEKEFLLADEGDIPERYREQVSEYFKRLSVSEGSR